MHKTKWNLITTEAGSFFEDKTNDRKMRAFSKWLKEMYTARLHCIKSNWYSHQILSKVQCEVMLPCLITEYSYQNNIHTWSTMDGSMFKKHRIKRWLACLLSPHQIDWAHLKKLILRAWERSHNGWLAFLDFLLVCLLSYIPISLNFSASFFWSLAQPSVLSHP